MRLNHPIWHGNRANAPCRQFTAEVANPSCSNDVESLKCNAPETHLLIEWRYAQQKVAARPNYGSLTASTRCRGLAAEVVAPTHQDEGRRCRDQFNPECA
jgi:hypothetical protein